MDRGEATGFGVAFAGHALLLGVLSLGFASATRPPIVADSIEVAFVDEIGLKAAVTEASSEAQAPEVGPPEETAPEPAEAPPEPTPTPPPPQPKLAAPTPQPAEKPAKPSPPKAKASPAPPKAAPAKPAPAKAVANAAGAGKQARASRLGSDFLKGLADPSSGKAEKPRAAVSSRNMAGLAAAIIQQVKPCYVVPSGGTEAERIQTVLRLRFREDGSTATPPAVVEQNGVTGNNRAYARQMADAAKRAVLRCSPLKLPPDLYQGGWEDIEFTFRPEAMS